MNTTNLAYSSREELNEADRNDQKAESARSGLQHIHIGTNTTVRATRERPERERFALRWLSAFINREKLTAEDICEQLQTDVITIRAALTNPAADVKQLVSKIESLRALMDAQIREPAPTAFFQAVAKAFRYAMKTGALVEIIDITRSGKSTAADFFHLKNLHRAVLVDCPDTESYHSFIVAVARGCGVSVGSGKKGKKTPQLEEQIESMLGAGGFDLLILDEGHYLWPTNIKLKPKRVEHVRKLWDRMKRRLAVVILSTPQSIMSSNQALRLNDRWAPGQWEGRIERFRTPKTVEDADIEKVVRFHFPEGTAEMLRPLVVFTKNSPGFYGAMVNVLNRARFEAEEAGEKLTSRHIVAEIANAIRDTALATEMQKKGVK